MKAVTVCVEYDDLLAITLPSWRPHFSDIVVVTTPEDHKTIEVASGHGAKVVTTFAFYDYGAEFNKGVAMEMGFDAIGRDGWICVLDADIVLPEAMPVGSLNTNYLYGARRYEVPDPRQWNGFNHVEGLRMVPDTEIAGYFQLFHASAKHLFSYPWYPINYRSAASCDSVFSWKFGRHCGWLPFQVAHLGTTGDNWCGRATRRLDGGMSEYSHERTMARERLVLERMAGNHSYEHLKVEQ